MKVFDLIDLRNASIFRDSETAVCMMPGLGLLIRCISTLAGTYKPTKIAAACSEVGYTGALSRSRSICIPDYLCMPSPPYTEALPANQVRVARGSNARRRPRGPNPYCNRVRGLDSGSEATRHGHGLVRMCFCYLLGRHDVMRW